MAERALPGFRDFYPPELAERNHVMAAWRRVALRFGFQEYDGPPLEPLDLYTRKSGEEIVTQLYNFVDKGGREVALRPEMTPTFARMVGARANALRKPVRWFSIPQLFRYERQQKGRLREHFQLNVDIVGEGDVSADAELVAVCVEIMRELGLTSDDVKVRVSDRRLLAALLRAHGIEEAAFPVVFAVIDKVEREPEGVLLERLRHGGVDSATSLRLLEVVRGSKGQNPTDYFSGLAAIAESERAVLDSCVADFARYLEYARSLGISEWITFDLSIVRGLAYYTGIVFELFDARGAHRAICGGGRYDKLLAALGGVDLPALGFGMGDVVLSDILRERGVLPGDTAGVDFWVASDTHDLLDVTMQVATRIRRAGLSAEYPLREQSLSRQLRAAEKAGARRAVIVKRELLDAGNMIVRDLQSGAEETVSYSAWQP